MRKWVRRYDGTLASLKERSRVPRRRPNRISPQLEAAILYYKRRLPTWRTAKLQRDFNLPCSARAIARVCRQYMLSRPRKRRKHKIKRDLRALKQRAGAHQTATQIIRQRVPSIDPRWICYPGVPRPVASHTQVIYTVSHLRGYHVLPIA